jgi:hypothetical protein
MRLKGVTERYWLASVAAVVVLFLLFNRLIPIVFYNLPGSPTYLSGHMLSDEELRLFSFYRNVVLGTFAYLLAGILASIFLSARGIVVCATILLAISHFYYRVGWAAFAFDYVRVSAFGLGIVIGLGMKELGRARGHS